MIPPATPDELYKLESLRNRSDSFDRFDDGYLLRWLRGSMGDLDATVSALCKHVDFRNAWDLDQLLTSYKWPEVLLKYIGYGYCGPDKDGAPVLLSLLGNTDVEGIFKSCQAQEYIKYTLMAIEYGMQQCEALAKRTGNPYEQMLLVLDMENMSSAHYSFKAFVATFVTLLSIYQENYPLALKKILVIRAPTMARYAYSALTPFLADSTQALIGEIPENWEEVLFSYVGRENWPQCWGGHLTDGDGDPACRSLLRGEPGPVPPPYFVKREALSHLWHDQTTVYAGDKLLIELFVGTRGSTITWHYMTLTDDIGFAVYLDERGDGDDLETMHAVFPYVRLECSVVPVSGHFVCRAPGRYIIEFDNYYSWFSAKELHYRVDLIEKS